MEIKNLGRQPIEDEEGYVVGWHHVFRAHDGDFVRTTLISEELMADTAFDAPSYVRASAERSLRRLRERETDGFVWGSAPGI